MHTLIVGITESGKTSLAKKLAEKLVLSGKNVLILTPIFDKWPDGVFLYDDEDVFLQNFWNTKGCYIFIDEGKQTIGRYNEAMIETATRGRHWGHSIFYMAQRASMISTDVRGQCSQLYCFSQGKKDSMILSEEFSQSELENATELNQGECFWVQRFSKDGKKFCKKINTFKF